MTASVASALTATAWPGCASASPGWAVRWRSSRRAGRARDLDRSEEHTSELQSLMRTSYAVFCLNKKKNSKDTQTQISQQTHVCIMNITQSTHNIANKKLS